MYKYIFKHKIKVNGIQVFFFFFNEVQKLDYVPQKTTFYRFDSE